LTVSVHRDPIDKFPYYSGLEDEVGLSSGYGWNYNFCLQKETKEEKYLQTLDLALAKIKEKKCDFLVISAGFDTYKLDPICDFELEIETYTKIANKIKKLNLPIVILQEGGYHLQDLGECVSSFLEPFNS
jgi:acetoin utilization deacetylase AcuC-like enzyme